MSRNSYFPPQTPLQQPQPSQFQTFSPQYPPPAQNPPSQQPWIHPQLCTSPPPSAPPTPYNPSAFTSPVLSPRDSYYPPRNPPYPQQQRPQVSVGGYTGPAYNQLPGDAPPTPALSPSSVPCYSPNAGPSTTQQFRPPASIAGQTQSYVPYNPSGSNLRETSGSATQYFELPAQQQVGQDPPPTQPSQQQQPGQWNTQNSGGQLGVNPLPTPAYTPAPYGHNNSYPADPGSSTTQYFPFQPPTQPTEYSPPAQSSQGQVNTPSKFSQTISSAVLPQGAPPLQEAQPPAPTVFEVSSHPSPPLQIQSLISPPQLPESQNIPLDQLQSEDQLAQEAQFRPQGQPAQESQSLPPATQQVQPQNQSIPQVQPQPLSAQQPSSQPPPPNQTQAQWAPVQQPQSEFPPLEQLQSHNQATQVLQSQPPPAPQVFSQPSPHQQVQPPNPTNEQTQSQPLSSEQVHSPPPPPTPIQDQQAQTQQAQTQQAQPVYPPPQQLQSHNQTAQAAQSQPPPAQNVYPQPQFHQVQWQAPPPEQVQPQYAPNGQAQLPSSEGPSQYPPPPPYSQVPDLVNGPPVYNPSTYNQQAPAPPFNSPQIYNPQSQPSQNSYPQEKQQYEQNLVQSFQVQLQVSSSTQQPQVKQQYQPNQAAPTHQQPQYPPPGQQAQGKLLYEQSTVQSFQQQWHSAPVGQPPEKQQWQQNQTQYVQQQYPAVGLQQPQYSPQPQYPPMGQPQPQPQYPQVQNFSNPLMQPGQQANSGFMPAPPPFVPAPLDPTKDDHKSSKTKRFLGDTLVGRVARSSVSTVTSTVKMPMTLSPWGDNNPVTLPNVRYRDAILFTTFAVVGGPMVDGASNLVTDTFGAETFISEIISSGAGFITGNLIVKYGVFQIVEQAIDKGILEHILPEVERTIRTTSVKSLQVSIKHKLMGVEADLRFIGTYPTTSTMACDKGWFAPYLFSSSRTPVIPRSNDFAIAQFFAPYVAADTALTHKILSESPCVIPFCDPNPTHPVPHSRLFIFFTGISPFRANMWSTSRRPGCAQIIFHLLDGCPALVIPVATARTPVMAWSPWTLSQMQIQNRSASGYSPERQIGQIVQWVSQLVEWQGLYPCVRDVSQAFDRMLWRVLGMMINGALAAGGATAAEGKVLGKIDAERAGIVMFRY